MSQSAVCSRDARTGGGLDREGVPHAVVGRIGGAGGEGRDVFVMEGERGMSDHHNHRSGERKRERKGRRGNAACVRAAAGLT